MYTARMSSFALSTDGFEFCIGFNIKQIEFRKGLTSCRSFDYSNFAQVRTNIVVALGDLAFRFPNALEPWNPKIYDRLRDSCPRVRANAIMVLTHLILNDMVKVWVEWFSCSQYPVGCKPLVKRLPWLLPEYMIACIEVERHVMHEGTHVIPLLPFLPVLCEL